MSFGNLWKTLHPVEARLLGGSGRQPNVGAPKWNQVGPGRWEMEGGVPANQGPSGPRRDLGGSLYPPTQPQMQTGGGGQMSTMPGYPMQTGGGGQMQQLPAWLTGGPGQQMGGFSGQTGGGLPPMGGSSYQPSGWGQESDPYNGGFAGNFGMGAWR